MLIPTPVFALIAAADRESSRYALGGIRFERDLLTGQPNAIATDGRCMIAATWPEANPQDYPHLIGNASPKPGFGVVMPFDACKTAAKHKLKSVAAKKKPILANVLLDEHATIPETEKTPAKLAIVTSDGESTSTATPDAQHGRFPKWKDIVPARHEDDCTSIYVDPRIMAKCLLAIAEFADSDEDRGVVITFDSRPQGYKHAVTITAERADGRKAVAVLMPYAKREHANGPDIAPVPGWLAGGAIAADRIAAAESPAPEVTEPEVTEPEVIEPAAVEPEAVADPTPIEKIEPVETSISPAMQAAVPVSRHRQRRSAEHRPAPKPMPVAVPVKQSTQSDREWVRSALQFV